MTHARAHRQHAHRGNLHECRIIVSLLIVGLVLTEKSRDMRGEQHACAH